MMVNSIYFEILNLNGSVVIKIYKFTPQLFTLTRFF